MTTSVNYYFTKMMVDLFMNRASDSSGVSFGSIGTQADFWETALGPIMNSIYWESWYNGENSTGSGYIFYENKLLGVPRLRQLRVKNGSCSVHKSLRSLISDCYDDYGFSAEDQSAFSIGKTDPTNKAY
jgi:hypothetical protein